MSSNESARERGDSSSSSDYKAPRKYELKSDEEKGKPAYKMHRMRNNDSVHRCREKARQTKMEHDAEFERRGLEIARLNGELKSYREKEPNAEIERREQESSLLKNELQAANEIIDRQMKTIQHLNARLSVCRCSELQHL